MKTYHLTFIGYLNSKKSRFLAISDKAIFVNCTKLLAKGSF